MSVGRYIRTPRHRWQDYAPDRAWMWLVGAFAGGFAVATTWLEVT